MPAKFCRKHNKSFFGPRCPDCTAVPSAARKDEDLPFPDLTPLLQSSFGTVETVSIPSDPTPDPIPIPDTTPDFGGFGGGDSGGGGSSDTW